MLRRNVLIFHTGALGDFVVAWPLVVALGRLHPQSRIICVTAASKGKLAERVLGVDSQDAETGWPALHVRGAPIPKQVADTLSRTHAVYEFTYGEDSDWARNIATISPEVVLTHIPGRPPDNYQGHASEHLLESLSTRPATRTAVEQILRSIRERGVSTRRTVGNTIVIHPGSGSERKNWPLARFIELAARAKQIGRQVRFVVGEVERERWSESNIDQLSSVAGVVSPKDYVSLHASISDAAAYVGNDSGPTHLAAMCGVPTVAVFVDSNPAVWSPIGPKVATLGAVGSTPSIDGVWNAVERAISSSG